MDKTPATHSPLYSVWAGIKARTMQSSSKFFPKYGGAGRGLFQPWQKDFRAFEKYCLENGWWKGCHIDRFPDKNGGYEPGNIRFTTQQQNNRNRIDARFTEGDIIQIKLLRHQGLTQWEIAHKYGCAQRDIFNILNELAWAGINPTEEQLAATPVSINKRSHRLGAEVVREILMARLREGLSHKKLAKKYNASTCAISRILSGKAWPEIFREFNYVKMAMFPHPRADYMESMELAA
jgi:plasmid maintenance system antidote protein VapI